MSSLFISIIIVEFNEKYVLVVIIFNSTNINFQINNNNNNRIEIFHLYFQVGTTFLPIVNFQIQKFLIAS